MQISAAEEFSLRLSLQLARHHARGEATLPASTLATLEGISVEYASKTLHQLKQAGLVRATRGTQGGYALTKPAGELTLLDIFLSTERGRTSDPFCESFSGKEESCVHSGNCSIRPVWFVLKDYFDEVLGRVTLQDLLLREDQVKDQVTQLAAQRAAELVQTFKGETHVPS